MSRIFIFTLSAFFFFSFLFPHSNIPNFTVQAKGKMTKLGNDEREAKEKEEENFKNKDMKKGKAKHNSCYLIC